MKFSLCVWKYFTDEFNIVVFLLFIINIICVEYFSFICYRILIVLSYNQIYQL